ncbi:MAG: hypothetical protein JNM95_10115 [Chitinophagaceae bacterium]|nr:hypothetical protein [Chitinophagaceae bacterium]
MKKIIIIFQWIILSLFIACTVYAQSISPRVIASLGAYQVNAIGSLSFTVGETNTQTLTSASHILTQGFQQPIEINLLHVRAFLQGFYLGAEQMTDVLYNQGVYLNPSNVADSITLELHDAITPSTILFGTKSTLKQDGSISVKGLGVVGQSYYLVIKHRNSISVWSSTPVLLSNVTTYDFTTQASMAYGANQAEVEPGIWALYSGDINQDDIVDVFDYLTLEPDIVNGSFGYLHTDTNGDGAVDIFDFLILEGNLINGIGAATP